MAIALDLNQRNGLSLDRFAQVLGLHPLHFNQVQFGDSTLCGVPVLQYAWQSADRTARENIAQAIAHAEALVESYLGYPLSSKWFVDELPLKPNRYLLKQCNQKSLIAGGVRATLVVESGAAITYSDVDSDTYDETATITVNVGTIPADELHVYYPGYDGAYEYEIRPIHVSITAGVATITFRREQCLLIQYMTDMFDPVAQLGDDDTLFLTEVDVYREYNDDSIQAELISFAAGCCAEGCIRCTESEQTACLGMRDKRNGIVAISPAVYSRATSAWYVGGLCAASASKVRLHYCAGPSSHNMTPEWERTIARFALSLLEHPICKCSYVGSIGNFWREDLAVQEGFGGNLMRSAVQNVIIQCPLGTTRGAVAAWRMIQQEQIGSAAIHA